MVTILDAGRKVRAQWVRSPAKELNNLALEWQELINGGRQSRYGKNYDALDTGEGGAFCYNRPHSEPGASHSIASRPTD